MMQNRTSDRAAQRQKLVLHSEEVANALFAQADPRSEALPSAALRRLQAEGFYTAPLPSRYGGLGLGTEEGGHRPLLRCLAAFGGADLALGRLYEGHVNALILIDAFGTGEQRQQAADDAHAGKLFGVWNTGDRTPMSLEVGDGRFFLHGCKAFATGAGTVERPIVTAEHRGWQMTLPRMELPAVAPHLRIDRSSWHPLGMQASESYTIDFGGATLQPGDLIGQPSDFYRDPLFRGGAIRFAAVQAGAVLRLAQCFSEWLEARGRGSDPYQIARRGEVELLAQTAALWVERAADVAEDCLWPGAAAGSCAQQMVQCGNTTRLAVERAATAVMTHVTAGVGAHGLLQPERFARIVRDLTMYLRQPNPDGALADVGRAALAGASEGYWREPNSTASSATAPVCSAGDKGAAKETSAPAASLAR